MIGPSSSCFTLMMVLVPENATPCTGVLKSGTTDLFEKLNMLPQFSRPFRKEPAFWDNIAGFQAYLENFQQLADVVQVHCSV